MQFTTDNILLSADNKDVAYKRFYNVLKTRTLCACNDRKTKRLMKNTLILANMAYTFLSFMILRI